MKKINNFKVITGGVTPKEKSKKKFVSAYITDTRLMGAMGMFVHWELINCSDESDFVQFFYFDTEEYGMENYQGIWGYNRQIILTIEHTTIGTLGGKKIPISEDEVCYLVQHYHEINVEKNLPLPLDWPGYKFILEKDINFSEADVTQLNKKISVPIESDVQLVNYTVMRIFGRDFEGARILFHEDSDFSDIDIFPDFVMGTLYKNTVEEDVPTSYGQWYRCTSLVEVQDKYYICTSRVLVRDLKVVAVEGNATFSITSKEAAMILSRPEFVSIFDIKEGVSPDEDTTLELSFNTTCQYFDNGRLLMAFKSNNDHVKENVYLLSNDIYGAVFISNYGQFVLVAYDLPSIQHLEYDLMKSNVEQYLELNGRFEFKNSILFDFLDSGFDDFLDFVEFIEDK